MKWILLCFLLGGCSLFGSDDGLDHLVGAGQEALEEYGPELPPILVTWRRDTGPLAECRQVDDVLVIEVHAGRIVLMSSDRDEQAKLFKQALVRQLEQVTRGSCE